MIMSVKSKVKWLNKWCGEKKGNLAPFCTSYSKVYSNLVPHRKISSLRVPWGEDAGSINGCLGGSSISWQTHAASGWGSFKRDGLQICNAFLLGLKGLIAAKPKHADNMGSVGINTTETLQGFWNWENILCISCAERIAIAQTFGSLGQFHHPRI